MKTIEFRLLERNPELVRFDVIESKDGGKTTELNDLYFQFSEPILYSHDDLALAWASLCGQQYDQIVFPSAVSEKVHRTIKSFTRSELIAEIGQDQPRASRSGHALSFSGGLDSMACLALLPEDTKLVSIDFGGHFDRERKFFQEFDPLIVSTNCRDTHLTDNSWAFMCIGALLTSSHFNSKYHTFGSIFASNMGNPPVPGTFSLLSASGYQGADLIKGLSEVATTKIVLQAFSPSMIQRAFDSLAGPNDNKRLRKAALIRAVSKTEGLPNPLPETTPLPERKLKFGHYFADDFLSFYIAQSDPSALGTFENMPTDVRNAIDELDLSFMARLNTDFCEHLPKSLLPNLYARTADFGILPYRSNDWANLQQIKEILSPIHSGVV